jgi:hypothetical protein
MSIIFTLTNKTLNWKKHAIIPEQIFYTCKGRGKRKVHPRTSHEGPKREKRYSPTLSLTLVLDGGAWSMRRPGRFIAGKTGYPLYRRLSGHQGQSGRMWKILPPHWDSIPGPSSPQQVTIPTQLSRPSILYT